MSSFEFPNLPLADWRATRDTLQGYAKVLGSIRRVLSARQRHWASIALQISGEGLTTTPIPWHGRIFELRLDLPDHHLTVVTNDGERRREELEGQSVARFAAETRAALAGLDIEIDSTVIAFDDDSAGEWDREAISRFWKALVAIDTTFKAFKGEQRRETSPVQLFPHHFDLALSWYSGRLVPDQDPAKEDLSDEQMTFGFSTGDETIADPYFYATAYPEPEGFAGYELPAAARWQAEVFSGAVLPYTEIVGIEDAEGLLFEFLRMAHRAGVSRMLDAPRSDS